MNIDLRNISEQFELEVTRVKQKHGFNTNSKAVEHCTIMFLKREAEIESLKKKLDDKIQELALVKNNVYHFKKAFENLVNE